MPVPVFLVEYVLRLWSSVESDSFRAPGGSASGARLRYFVSFHAVIDLLAILPFFLMTFGVFGSADMRFLRAIPLLRVLKLTRYSPALGALLDVIQRETEALLAAFVVLLLMLVFSASGIFLLQGDMQPETFGSIRSSMWWSIVTLTTVGYGDVTPVGGGVRMLAIFEALAGQLYLTLLVARLVGMYGASADKS